MKNMKYIAVLVLGFSLIFNFTFVSSQSNDKKNPKDLALACGSKGGKDEDGRVWEEDLKYLTDASGSVQAEAGSQDPSLFATIPYMHARIFKSPATYKFSIEKDKRYILRFYFYPSTYQEFNVSNSYFTVTAGSITLMSNFSAAIRCKALTQAYIIQEYSLAPLGSKELQVVFTPSTSPSDSFAFVNGIELVPMPELFGEIYLVGYEDSSHTLDGSYDTFQNMYRLNVGGNNIPPSKDAGGLYRTWYNDFPYLYAATLGTTGELDKSMKIKFKNISSSSAPEAVYRTSRSMGLQSDINVNYNLTWVFQVDGDFAYLVRLHLCETEYKKMNQRVFQVFINNQTAPLVIDIAGLTGGKGIPIYVDFAAHVEDGPGDRLLQINLHPDTESQPQFYDAILNGIEIFKATDPEKGLAGKNPQLSQMMLETENPKKFAEQAKKNNVMAIGATTGGVAGAFVVVALLLFFYSKKRKVQGDESHTSSWLPLYGNSHVTGSKSNNHSTHLSTLAQGLSRHFSISEIKQATKNFEESNVIGVGGFGKVYKGVIDDGTKVAIKRSNPSSEQGINEFQTEIEMLSQLRHKHLVSLIGFCEDGGEMCLVYDYMALGTFREHIYNSKKSNLSWKQRLEICIGAARGLHYLHTGAKYTIIHRDVKTTNILLDENWVAKVSDFGLSKTGPDMNQGHVSTVVKGSFGYLDPEYFRRQQLTEKSDVYSFGVVLFEALCSRPALNPNLPKEQVSLADWAISCHQKGALKEIIDPKLRGKIDPECLSKFADTAVKCLSDQGIDRPHMGDVLWNLEFALQLQETSDIGGSSKRGSSHQGSLHSRGSSGLSLGSEHELSESKDESAIFSQLVNPTGR